MNSTMRKSMVAMLMALPMFLSAEPSTVTPMTVLDMVFADAAKIFGRARGDLGYPNALISGTIGNFINAGMHPFDEMVEIDKGIYFSPGCRPHSCDEKGAVIVDANRKKLLAAALRHFNCKSAPPKGESSRCDSEPSLVIYLVNDPKNVASAGMREKHVEILTSWSKQWGPYMRETVVDIKRK